MSIKNTEILYNLIDEYLHENDITIDEFTTLMLQLLMEALVIRVSREELVGINGLILN